jgi:hypothetical protein
MSKPKEAGDRSLLPATSSGEPSCHGAVAIPPALALQGDIEIAITIPASKAAARRRMKTAPDNGWTGVRPQRRGFADGLEVDASGFVAARKAE